MLAVLVVFALAFPVATPIQVAEVDPAIQFLFKKKDRPRVVKVPVCVVPPGTYDNLECA